MNRIKRARGTNSVMTGVFYLIAVFFFALLISFASYVIIKDSAVRLRKCSAF